MTKYRVVLGEVASYEIHLEAPSQEIACERAEKIMETKGVKAFWCEVHAREVDHVSVLPTKKRKALILAKGA